MRLRFTALWFLFGPVMGCMWMAAVNYSNNLVYAILYLIAGLTFVSIFHTWRNMATLEIEHVRIKPAFAGEEIEAEIHLRNRGRHASYNLLFDRIDGKTKSSLRSYKGARVEAGDGNVVTVFMSPQQRGAYEMEKLVVRSAYPFGLFWAIMRVPVHASYFVYPAPRGRAELPEQQIAAGETGQPTRAGDDFYGVRAYVPGESLRHIDWKAFARGRPLVVKQFVGGQGRELWLEARTLARLPLEDRLSQVTLWAIEAEQGDVPYGLSLSDVHITPALGSDHKRRVLEALAIAGRDSSNE